MTYVWDTNILLHTIRNESFLKTLNQKYHFFDTPNIAVLSAVTIGEIHSIAIRNHWGKTRMANLAQMIKKFTTIPVTDSPEFIQFYSDMDTYSQNQHPTLKMSGSARKMGKNDLWIATTTAVLNGKLISTDDDFTHLNGLFFSFDKIIV
jgi:predicted nucleic acid-binding protein